MAQLVRWRFRDSARGGHLPVRSSGSTQVEHRGFGARHDAEGEAADLASARGCFAALPVPAHFALIDMARLPGGRLALMEAELIEPQLFFFDVPAAADLVAEAALELVDARQADRT